MLVSYLSLEQILKIYQILKEEGFIWAQSLEIQSVVGWPIAFGPVMWQYIMVGVCNKGSCSPHGGWNMRKEEERW